MEVRIMTRLVGLIAAVLMAGVTAPGFALDPIVIRFSHVVASDTPKGRAAERFAALAAERTKGRVRVEVHPNSRLYGDRDEMAALQAGHVEMLAPSLSKIKVLRLTEFEVFDLPYLFSDIEAVHRITRGAIGRELLDRLAEHGVVGLAYWDNGFKQMSANKPLRKPQDAAGLVMRIQPSKVIEVQMTTLGARPLVLEFSEVFTSLKVGTVNGTENPPSNFYTQNMHHAQKYLTLTDHGYLGYAVLVNRNFWEGLPTDLRGQLEGAMRDATAYANEAALQDNTAALQAIGNSRRTLIIELTPEEKHAWRLALAPVHEDAQRRIPRELIERIYQAVGYAPPQ
jgi:C4-dicarboxylate-binding protein DctP